MPGRPLRTRAHGRGRSALAIAAVAMAMVAASAAPGAAAMKPIRPPYESATGEDRCFWEWQATCSSGASADASMGRMELGFEVVTDGEGSAPGRGVGNGGTSIYATHLLRKPASEVVYTATFRVDRARAAADSRIGEFAEAAAAVDLLASHSNCAFCQSSASGASIVSADDSRPESTNSGEITLRTVLYSSQGDRVIPRGPVSLRFDLGGYAWMGSKFEPALPEAGSASVSVEGALTSIGVNVIP